jgi:hypothetical protein
VPKADAGHRKNLSPLDRRVDLLSKELNLDPGQQGKVKALLLAQRAQVNQIWNDESVPAPVRVKTTQSIGERTADRIRALLSDEQRKKYSKPIERNAARGDDRPDVEAWMQGRKTM